MPKKDDLMGFINDIPFNLADPILKSKQMDVANYIMALIESVTKPPEEINWDGIIFSAQHISEVAETAKAYKADAAARRERENGGKTM